MAKREEPFVTDVPHDEERPSNPIRHLEQQYLSLAEKLKKQSDPRLREALLLEFIFKFLKPGILNTSTMQETLKSLEARIKGVENSPIFSDKGIQDRIEKIKQEFLSQSVDETREAVSQQLPGLVREELKTPEMQQITRKSILGRFYHVITGGIAISVVLAGIGLYLWFNYRANKDSADTIRGEIAKVAKKDEARSSTLEGSLATLTAAVNVYRAETAIRFDDPEEGIFPKEEKLETKFKEFDKGLDTKIDLGLIDRGLDKFREYKVKTDTLDQNYETLSKSVTTYEDQLTQLQKDLQQAKITKRDYEARVKDISFLLKEVKLLQKEQDARIDAELQEFLDGLRQPFKLELYPTSQLPQTSQPSSRPAPELKPEYQPAE